MPEGVDALTDLQVRVKALDLAVRAGLLALGDERPDVHAETSNPAEPAFWIRNQVLVSVTKDTIIVGRIGRDMASVEEIGRFPPDALMDAAKAAVLDIATRAVGRAVELALMEQA
jgi:hypothetical protein